MHKICEECKKSVKKVGKLYRIWVYFDRWLCRRCREKHIKPKHQIPR